MPNKILLLYEVDQIEEITNKFSLNYFNQSEIKIISLNYEVHERLKKLGIKHQQHIKYEKKGIYKDNDKSAIDIAKKIVKIPELEFFTYRNINILSVEEWWISNYFGKILGYISLFERIMRENNEAKKLILPHITLKDSDSVWDYLGRKAPIEVAKIFNKKKQIKIEIIIKKDLTKRKSHNFESKTDLTRKDYLSNGIAKLNNLLNQYIRSLNSNKNILVLQYWNRIVNIVKDLNDYKFVLLRVSPFTDLYKFKKKPLELYKNKIDFHKLNDFLNNKTKKSIEKRFKTIKKEWESLDYSIFNQKKFRLKGYSMQEIIRNMISELLTQKIKSNMIKIESIYNLINEKNIDLIILRISIRDRYKIAALVGKNLDIPTVELQHGIMNLETFYGFNPDLVDTYFCYGIREERNLKRNFKNNNIYPIGSPRFEEYIRYKDEHDEGDRKKILEKHNVNQEKRLLIYTPPKVETNSRRTFRNYLPTTSDFKKIFISINNGIKNIEGLKILIKFHPSDYKVKLHKKLAKEAFNDNVLVEQHSDLKELLFVSDGLITNFSTTGLEAMIMETPVIVYDYFYDAYNYYDKISKEGAVIKVNNSNQLNEQIERLLEEDFREEIIEKASDYIRRNYNFDMKSSKRARKIISKLL